MKDAQMATKHMEWCSTPLFIREMQTQTTMSDPFSLNRMAVIINTDNTMVWKNRNPHSLVS